MTTILKKILSLVSVWMLKEVQTDPQGQSWQAVSGSKLIGLAFIGVACAGYAYGSLTDGQALELIGLGVAIIRLRQGQATEAQNVKNALTQKLEEQTQEIVQQQEIQGAEAKVAAHSVLAAAARIEDTQRQ